MAKRYDYTEEEIRKKLEELGYSNIPEDQLKQFQKGKESELDSRHSSLEIMRCSCASYIYLQLSLLITYIYLISSIFADLKRLIEAEKAELLARGHPSLSTSDSSHRTDSYFEGSKDESKRSTDGIVS